MHFAQRLNIGQLQVGDALMQPFDKAIHALTSGVVTAAQIGGIDVRMGDDGHGLVELVEDDHAIIESEAEIRQSAIIRRRIGQALDVANGVIGGIADGTTAETRQSRHRRRAIGREPFLQ